jgi:hypothetical protein
MENQERFYTKEYKGKTIYVTDWSNLQEEDKLIFNIWESTRFLESLNKKDLLEMVIFRNSIVTKSVLLAMQKAAKVSRPFNKKKAGVSDFSPTRQYILKTINLFSQDKIEPFQSEVEAMDWLIAD